MATKTNKNGKNELPEVGKVMVSNKEIFLTPAEYFEKIKTEYADETLENVRSVYEVVMRKLDKAIVTGQLALSKALFARAQYLIKEYKLVEYGVTKYIERSTIDKFIDDVADEVVVVLELKNYEREIPDEVIKIVSDTREIFDNFFVIFTDYTGEKRKEVAKERRDKDPILFGNIYIDGKVSPKMYFIGDWVDEYCDLTLDKMITEVSKAENKDKKDYVFDIESTKDVDRITEQLNKLKEMGT